VLYTEANAITGAGVEKVFQTAVTALTKQRAGEQVGKGKNSVELEPPGDPAKGCC
jgi:hypothetical protein